MVYVSVTGLKLRRPQSLPRFYWHAIRSFRQAKNSDGMRFAETRTIAGVHHTLTVWSDRKSMLAYLTSGPHRQAMRVFAKIATGKVHGYESKTIPGWDEALAEWTLHAREV
ncbi:hypothetical protein [Nitratireductor sp. XY-223]|uniref:hypothetical protein n=1 Tax=Nitratireductor sp. XY-223 TaxID=2561926 RepID=UPI0010A9AF0B|nr:hypothetical protein [Nitratireductor sp. XY-223]